MNYKETQNEFDEKKWLESGAIGKDQCGKYDFCVHCVKTEENPCARAMERLSLAKAESERKPKTRIRLARLVPVKA